MSQASPMSTPRRVEVYSNQGSRSSLTAAQRRRIKHKHHRMRYRDIRKVEAILGQSLRTMT